MGKKKTEEHTPEELAELQGVGFQPEEAQSLFGDLVTIASPEMPEEDVKALLEQQLEGKTDEQKAVINKIFNDLQGFEAVPEEEPETPKEESAPDVGAEELSKSGQTSEELLDAPGVTQEPETLDSTPEQTVETDEQKAQREQAERDGSGQGFTFAQIDAAKAAMAVDGFASDRIEHVMPQVLDFARAVKDSFGPTQLSFGNSLAVPQEFKAYLVVLGLETDAAEVVASELGVNELLEGASLPVEKQEVPVLPEGLKQWLGPCTLPDGSVCRDAGCWDVHYREDGSKIQVSNCRNEGC